ncbi:MAG: minor capsid protein [Burkholderiales bacterium]|nr:minor capsid protein [Burkholderiales bacterium]
MTNQINELQPVESSRDIEDKYREELLTFFSSGIFLFDNSATHSAPSNMPKDDENMRNIANGAVTSVEAVKNDPIKLQNALTEYYSNDKLKKMTKRLFDTIDSYHKAEFDSQIKDLQIQSLQVPSSPSKKLPQVENSPTYQAYIEQLQFMNYTVTKHLRDDFIYSIILVVLMQELFNTPSKIENQIITDAVNKINERIEIISSDQSIKITQGLTMAKCMGLGLNQYTWQTMEDDRVRPTHAANNQEMFDWDQPPANTGHPGTEVNCRCRAVIKIDKSALAGMGDLLDIIG